MNRKEFLKEVKAEYKDVNATLHLRMVGWEDISQKIGTGDLCQRANFFNRFWIFSLAGLSLVVVGVFLATTSSLPGDPLYPVKILSERVTNKITGDNQLAIDHRADEIVTLAKEKEIKTEKLEYAVVQYSQVVDQTEQEIKSSGKADSEFKWKLRSQHQKFDRLVNDNPAIEKDLKGAQESSDRGDD